MAEYICPSCQKEIYDDDALLCHFCGGSLERASKGALGRMRYANPKPIWIALTILVLLSFILLFAGH